MRFLIRLRGEVPPDRLMERVRAISGSAGVEARNAKRTSYGALELDIFAPGRADFELFMAAVGPLAHVEFTRDLNQAPPFKEERELYAEAKALFNAERFWECHEVLEGIWKTKTGPEKRLIQGIILVCAAFVHHQKGEEAIALGLLARSSPLLDFQEPDYQGFAPGPLRERVRGMLASGALEVFKL